MANITVLGAGAWGTAVALSLAGRHQVLLWGRDRAAMDAMAQARENRAYLPGFALPPSMTVTADFEAALRHVAPGEPADTPLLIAACPVAGLRPLLAQLKGRPIPNVVWLCKGFEYGSGLLPHQVVAEVLGESVAGAALSGPSFAQEVAKGLPCALTVAMRCCHMASASAGYPLVELATTSAATRAGWRSASSCPTMPPIDRPTHTTGPESSSRKRRAASSASSAML